MFVNSLSYCPCTAVALEVINAAVYSSPVAQCMRIGTRDGVKAVAVAVRAEPLPTSDPIADSELCRYVALIRTSILRMRHRCTLHVPLLLIQECTVLTCSVLRSKRPERRANHSLGCTSCKNLASVLHNPTSAEYTRCMQIVYTPAKHRHTQRRRRE